MKLILENNTAPEDQELVRRLLLRQPEALEQLFARFRHILKFVIMQVLHDETEADDVLQEVLLKVWDQMRNYSPAKGRLVNWLSTIAKRRAIDRVRRKCSYQRATDRYEIFCATTSRTFDEDHPVEHDVYQGDLKRLLHQHIATLPLNQQQAVRMAYLESRSQREISTITHVPLGTVKVRIELGVKKLSRAMRSMEAKIL